MALGSKGHRTEYLCSGQQRGLIFTGTTNYLTVYFSSESHKYLNAKGFWLYYEGKYYEYLKSEIYNKQILKIENKCFIGRRI